MRDVFGGGERELGSISIVSESIAIEDMMRFLISGFPSKTNDKGVSEKLWCFEAAVVEGLR